MSKNKQNNASKLNEANQKKPSGANKIGSQSDTVSEKKIDEKKTIKEVTIGLGTRVWNSCAVAPFNALKGFGGQIKDATVDRWKKEKELYSQMGPAKYTLDRLGTTAIKVLKVAVILFAANMLNVYTMTKFGISIFAPQSLAIMGILALVAFIVKAYLSQKDAGTEKVDAKVLGANVMESFLSAAA